MSSQRYGSLIILGLILITVGFMVLVLVTGASSSGFIFVFPFFFFGDPGPYGLLFVLISASIILFFIYQFFRFQPLYYNHKSSSIIICKQCNEVLPPTAEYCMRCGNPVGNLKRDRQLD